MPFLGCFGHEDAFKLQFTQEALRRWGNLYSWSGKRLNRASEPIDDGQYIQIKCMAENPPKFMVTFKANRDREYDHCGEYVNATTRIVADPMHLARLIVSSRFATDLIPLFDAFPEDAAPRVESALRILKNCCCQALEEIHEDTEIASQTC